MKKISVVIVTYNSEYLIDECLKSLFYYNDIGDCLEVIIVDNCSDNSKEFINYIGQRYPNIIMVMNLTNGGYGQGNNVGIKIASASIIMIMNPDVRLVMPVFKYVYDKFNDSRLTLLGMSQWLDSGRKTYSYKFDNLYPTVWHIFANILLNKLNIFLPTKMYIEGACFFIRKSHFEHIGLFDERIFMYGEEVDVKHRILQSYGKRSIVFNKYLKYIHLISDRTPSLNSFNRNLESLMYLCDKFELNSELLLNGLYKQMLLMSWLNKIIRKNTKAYFFDDIIKKLERIVK